MPISKDKNRSTSRCWSSRASRWSPTACFRRRRESGHAGRRRVNIRGAAAKPVVFPPPPVQRTATSAIADILAGRRENAAEPIDAFNARRVFSDGAVPIIDIESNPLIPPETFAAMHRSAA